MPTPAAQWHNQRHARLLAAHPEIRSLQGSYAPSQLWVTALVVTDVAAAWAVRRSPWAVVLLAAFFVSAVFAHALGVLIHECTHNLVSHGSRSNKLWMIVANLPLLAPAAIEFRAQHLLHHKFLGEVDGRDTQAPVRAEIAFTGNSALKKIASFTFGRFFYKSRPANHVPFDRFLALNWAAQVVACGVLFWLVGWKGVAFLGVGALLAFGPHPLGARRLSEHFAALANQPSVSYYGPLNAVSFDVGYHVEHHDFPAIPWPRLRALRRLAHEEYDGLFALPSWTRLLLSHFFDRRYHLDQYVGFGVVLGDELGVTRFDRSQSPSPEATPPAPQAADKDPRSPDSLHSRAA